MTVKTARAAIQDNYLQDPLASIPLFSPGEKSVVSKEKGALLTDLEKSSGIVTAERFPLVVELGFEGAQHMQLPFWRIVERFEKDIQPAEKAWTRKKAAALASEAFRDARTKLDAFPNRDKAVSLFLRYLDVRNGLATKKQRDELIKRGIVRAIL